MNVGDTVRITALETFLGVSYRRVWSSLRPEFESRRKGRIKEFQYGVARDYAVVDFGDNLLLTVPTPLLSRCR